MKEPYCRQCGDPSDGKTDTDYLCSLCRRNRIWFDSARSVFRHRGPVRHLVHNLKYGNAVYLGEELAGFMAECIREHFSKVRFDAVLYIPLYKSRERGRTYNQARILAKALADQIGVELADRCLERSINTRTQTNLDSIQRRRNVRNAFRVKCPSWIKARRFLLVDDVMTTGATINETAEVLKEAGAVSVHVVTFARG